ncbi:MAG TPA: DNA repair protein RadA [Patescibacteria group bacterium]|nr:DNA repair protein RadA [Patescibacteria group bacterium]
MPKQKTLYICQSCGYETTQWVGQCLNCREWNTLVETVVGPVVQTSRSRLSSATLSSSVRPVFLSQVSTKPTKRVSTGMKEFDRVLGGGFVPGQVVLLAGEPGIGKSTLLTQISKNMSGSTVMYVSGEESVEQVKVRAQRMNYKADNLYMVPETNVDLITATLENERDLGLIIVDSIQTLYSEDLMGMAGSVGQVRGSAQKLTNIAKQLSVPSIIVGHVTKEGTVAGPKVLEHIVDTVLYLEGDSQHLFRVLKTTKNRFGPVSEVGIFEMDEEGMTEVDNPSKLFLSQKLKKTPGSCVTVVMEGQRPMLFEIQALTVRTAFGYPRRTTSGFNANRLLVLIAILEKTAGLNLQNHDVYLNVAGGYKVNEYACDLSVCLAIASSVKDVPIKDTAVAFGECGLSGEVRRVTHMERRTKEAKKLGYTEVVSPETVRSVKQAIERAL